MSIKEVCAWLNVSRSAVDGWRDEDIPAPFRPNLLFPHTWEVEPIELERWLAQRAQRHCSILHRAALDDSLEPASNGTQGHASTRTEPLPDGHASR